MPFRRKNRPPPAQDGPTPDPSPAPIADTPIANTVQTDTASSQSQDEPYKVGYGKPPLETRFQKGRSGNPKGRPKGARGLNTIVRENLLERVALRTAKGVRRITRIEALVRKQLEAAIGGDHKAMVHLMAIYAAAVPDAAHENLAAETDRPTDTDEAILQYFLEQVRKNEETGS